MFYVIDSQRIAVGDVLRSVLIRTSFREPKIVTRAFEVTRGGCRTAFGSLALPIDRREGDC
jgi:hypothetical protein